MMKSKFAQDILKSNRSTGQRHTILASNLRFRLSPVVYPPAPESIWLASYLVSSRLIQPKSRVLDYGCGCGILALTAARLGAKVTAVDINPFAVRLTRFNAHANGLDDSIEVRLGHGMSSLKPDEQFSLILANLPFEDCPPETWLEYSVWDHQHRMRKDLFQRLKVWDNFMLLLIHSNRLALTLGSNRFASRLRWQKVSSKTFNGTPCHIYAITPHQAEPWHGGSVAKPNLV